MPVEEKMVYLHFFLLGCDWYVVEYDGDDLFFGFAILNADYLNAEWGYVSFEELKELKVFGAFEVETDKHWKVRKAKEVDKIREAQGWRSIDERREDAIGDFW